LAEVVGLPEDEVGVPELKAAEKVAGLKLGSVFGSGDKGALFPKEKVKFEGFKDPEGARGDMSSWNGLSLTCGVEGVNAVFAILLGFPSSLVASESIFKPEEDPKEKLVGAAFEAPNENPAVDEAGFFSSLGSAPNENAEVVAAGLDSSLGAAAEGPAKVKGFDFEASLVDGNAVVFAAGLDSLFTAAEGAPNENPVVGVERAPNENPEVVAAGLVSSFAERAPNEKPVVFTTGLDSLFAAEGAAKVKGVDFERSLIDGAEGLLLPNGSKAAGAFGAKPG